MAHLIVGFAALPVVNDLGSRPSYSTAIACATVSSAFYHAAMPKLLHTVICRSREQRYRFIEAIKIQEERKRRNARWVLDYRNFVRRFHNAGVWGPDDWYKDYPFEFWDIIQGCDCIGLSTLSMELLSIALVEGSGMGFSACKRLVLGGTFEKWNLLTSTAEGLSFLGQLTHFAMWKNQRQQEDVGLPSAFHSIPFHLMTSLEYFTYPSRQRGDRYDTMVIYAVPEPPAMENGFMWWISCGDAAARRRMVPLSRRIPLEQALDVFEHGNLLQESDEIWRMVGSAPQMDNMRM
jgi:hypothetical protein